MEQGDRAVRSYSRQPEEGEGAKACRLPEAPAVRWAGPVLGPAAPGTAPGRDLRRGRRQHSGWAGSPRTGQAGQPDTGPPHRPTIQTARRKIILTLRVLTALLIPFFSRTIVYLLS